MEEEFAIISDTSGQNQKVGGAERAVNDGALRPLEAWSVLKFEERCPK